MSLGSLVVQRNDVAGGPAAQQDANQLRQTLNAGDERMPKAEAGDVQCAANRRAQSSLQANKGPRSFRQFSPPLV